MMFSQRHFGKVITSPNGVEFTLPDGPVMSRNLCHDIHSSKHPDLRILDASLARTFHPDPKTEHASYRIPTSVFFDIKAATDQSAPTDLMLAHDSVFMRECIWNDIRIEDIIVIYDQSGMLSAPRAYWMLKAYGAKNVFVLDGPLFKWRSEKRPTTKVKPKTGPDKRIPRPGPNERDDFAYKLDRSCVANFEDLTEFRGRVFDARFPQQYEKGHIPFSINMPFNVVLNEDRTFKTNDEIEAVFKEYGIENPKTDQVIFSCTRGISSCALDVAMRMIGNDSCKVYDGSY